MRIACWSGPRNISTALMRSWSSRSDSFVSDEPFYAYYLKEQQLKHPMYKEIIEHYPNKYENIKRYFTKEFQPYIIGKISTGRNKVKLNGSVSWK